MSYTNATADSAQDSREMYAAAHPFASSMEYDAFAAAQRRAAENAQKFREAARKASDLVLAQSPAMMVVHIRELEQMIRGASISAACNSDGTISVTLTWGT